MTKQLNKAEVDGDGCTGNSEVVLGNESFIETFKNSMNLHKAKYSRRW